MISCASPLTVSFISKFRAPTHELTRAHAVLHIRRQICGNAPDWALGREGLRQLTGRRGETAAKNAAEGEGALAPRQDREQNEADEPDLLAEEFAAIDAVLARLSAVLNGVAVEQPPRPQPTLERDPLIHDPDWDASARLDDWRSLLDRDVKLPPVLAAAVLWDAWESISPLQHQPWLGTLLVAAGLRQRRKTTAHLLALNVRLRVMSRERRRHGAMTTRLLAFLDAVAEAAALGLKEHDRLMLAREQMLRRTRDRRGNSKLPRLIDYVLTRPLVSSAMIEKELRVTTRGALNLGGELGLREIRGEAVIGRGVSSRACVHVTERRRISLGYVFLFSMDWRAVFCSVERKSERAPSLRKLKVCSPSKGPNGSFRGYASKFLESAARAERARHRSACALPEFEKPI